MSDPIYSPSELDGASIPTLMECLHSEYVQLRSDAACALGDRLRARELQTLDNPVHARLVALLEDSSFAVRFEAAIALAEIHDQRATPTLLQGAKRHAFRLDAIRALGTLGDAQAVPVLRNMLGRWLFPWADRLQTAAALCALGNPDGAAYLQRKLTSRRRAERAAAVHFIGESRHPEAQALLVNILGDARDPLRDVAARALGLLGDPRARAALADALLRAEGDLAQDIQEALRKLPAST